MIPFATSVQGFGFFSLWLITSWQTDNGSVIFSNFFVDKSKLSMDSPKKTMEGISGGIFLRLLFSIIFKIFKHFYKISVITSFFISMNKEKSI